MAAHEVVIRLGRPFDIQTQDGKFLAGVREITVPFADLESAGAAQAEITVSVRPVHDAGGEDYRPVVAGEVIQAADAEIRKHTARMRAAIIAPKPDLGDARGDLARDTGDLRGKSGD